jgi:hypothetical protein
MSSASSLAAKDVDLYDGARDVDHNDLVDESCALLSHQQSVIEGQVLQPKTTPVPKLQLATLCLIRYVAIPVIYLYHSRVPASRILEPIGFTQLFPYINEMLVDLNVISDPSRVGFISGLVVRFRAISQIYLH